MLENINYNYKREHDYNYKREHEFKKIPIFS